MTYQTHTKHYTHPQTNLASSRLPKSPQHVRCAKAIVEAFPDPIIVLSTDLHVHLANEAFYKTFKVTKTENTTIFDFDENQWDLARLRRLLTNILSKKNPVDTVELTQTFKNVGQKTMLLRAKRIQLENPTTDFILLIVQDITKRKIIQTQKDDFVGFVTHELKTPITSMHAFVEILQSYHTKTRDRKSQFLLTKVNIQMKRLTSLLNSFYSVYKLQTGKLALCKEQINMNTLVREIVETFQYVSETHEIMFRGNINHWIIADKMRINEVLINLITNAIKYSPDADKVIITLSENDQAVIVSVQDFGLGISQKQQTKVFDRFFRVQDKNQRQIKGVGLGLYIASNIIKQHKGKLWITSKPNEGSTFFFSLPKTTQPLGL